MKAGYNIVPVKKKEREEGLVIYKDIVYVS